jgi:hypothetical protein
MIALERFEIAYASLAMSRFNMAPREGYLKALKRILIYLKTFPNGRVVIDMSYQSNSECHVEDSKKLSSIQVLKRSHQMTFLYQMNKNLDDRLCRC